jgi:hypothetical protein
MEFGFSSFGFGACDFGFGEFRQPSSLTGVGVGSGDAGGFGGFGVIPFHVPNNDYFFIKFSNNLL